MKRLLPSWSAVLLLALVGACSHQPLVPEGKNVTARREDPSPSCENLGAVEGRNRDLKGDMEKAIEDLKLEAAKKGANYVRVEVTSGYGNSVRGTAFRCP